MGRITSARPRGARPDVPAKMTSSILPPRRLLTPCSPITQAIASTTLLLPEPFGPTTQVMPGSKRRVVGAAKDLKPLSVRLLRCTSRLVSGDPCPDAPAAGKAEPDTTGRRRDPGPDTTKGAPNGAPLRAGEVLDGR